MGWLVRFSWFLLLSPGFAFSAPLNVEVSAKSAILMNLDTGAILYEKEPHLRSFPASITKIATALYILEKYGPSLEGKAMAHKEIIATVSPYVRQQSYEEHPNYRLESDGTNIGISIGEVFSLKFLFLGMLISSANDATNVLAHHLEGDIDRFVAHLNQFLKTKGIQETHFLNPTGLHHPQHWTTAYDMALITKEALKHPLIRETVKTVQIERPQTNKQAPRLLTQTNRLLRKGAYYYPKAIGVKTGNTAKAGRTLVAAAEHEGRTLIAVVLGCPDTASRYKDVVRLFEAAFKETQIHRTLFSSLYDHFKLEIPGSKTSLEAALKEDVVLDYFPAEEPKLKGQIAWHPLRLPIREGEEVGVLQLLTQEGTLFKSYSLFAFRDVEKKWTQSLIDFCIDYKKGIFFLILALNICLGLVYFLKKPSKVI